MPIFDDARGYIPEHSGEPPEPQKERRGFASMDPKKQREIASKGGRAAHAKKTAHEWTSDEAREAGRKGGTISRGGRGRLIPDVQNNINRGDMRNPSGDAE